MLQGDAVSHLGAVYMKGRKTQEPGRSYKVEQLFVGFTCRNFSPCSYQVEKLLTIAGDNNKHEIIPTFQ